MIRKIENLPLQECVNAFGEDLAPVLSEKLASLEKRRDYLVDQVQQKKDYRREVVKDKLRKYNRPKSEWEMTWFLVYNLSDLKLKKALEGVEEELKNVKRAYSLATGNKSGELDIETAKEYPIQSLFVGELKKSGDRLVGGCPFHKDTYPSFFVYPNNNTFYCFGCGKSGDSIAFEMALSGADFKTAVRRLM